MKIKITLAIATIALLCSLAPVLPSDVYDYITLNLPTHFTDPVNPFANVTPFDNTPSNNVVTNDGATLGRVLFYDKNLSLSRTISCGSCHQQQFGFSDTAIHSMGFNGTTRRHSMPLINVKWHMNGKMFWDERATSLEAQVLMPIQDPVEMGLTLTQLVQRVQEQSYYPQLFVKAFGDTAVTTSRISYAMAQFVRSIVSRSSKYDSGRSQVTSLNQTFPNFTTSENQGKNLFFRGIAAGGGECYGCHTSEAFINAQFGPMNNGIDAVSTTDLGAFEPNGVDSTLIGRFKVSTLRNVELTAPYMHDGRFKTLEEVIDHYSTGIKLHRNLSPRFIDTVAGVATAHKFNFTTAQKTALVAFLKTFTDRSILTEPKWSDPFSLSTVLPIELTSFNAQCNGDKVNIYWTTASESNNDYFEVERSTDAISFTPVTRVNSQNSNSNTPITYSTIDNNPIIGRTYYRLKQVDINGRYSYSSIIVINCITSSTSTSYSVSIYPNPSSDNIIVTADGLIKNRIVDLEIVGLNGKKLYSQKIFLFENQSIKISDYPDGTYFLTIKIENQSITKKFIKK